MVPPTAPSARRSFRFRRKIGSGAFGEVYLAELTTGGGFAKVVAVKVLKPEFLEEADIVARMRDEARLLGHLRHPAIVQADDLLMLGGRVAIVMEYVPGANLLWLIHPRQNPEPLPPGVLVAIIGRVAEALEAAWARPSALTGEPLRVLHRDIKPSNIRITPDGEVKVLDFGVARADALERETSTHNQLIGSLTFLAPEVFLSHPVLPATDIYALGVTFFESIARSRFGRCGLTPEVHQRLLQERLGSLDLGAWGACGEPVRRLLGEMLAFEPVHRPTAGGVAAFCARHCRAMAGPELKEWARTHVERIAATDKDEPDGELVGTTMDEDSSQRGSMVNVPTLGDVGPDDETEHEGPVVPPSRRGLYLAVALVLLLVVPALVASGVGIAWFLDTRASSSVPPVTAAARPTPPSDPAPAAVVPPEPVEVPSLADAFDDDEPVAEPPAPVARPQDPAPRPVSLAPTRSPAATASPAPATASGSSRPAPAPTAVVAPAPVVAEQPPAAEEREPAAAKEPEVAVAKEPEAAPVGGGALSVQVTAPRRSLRNSQLYATVNTGLSGCRVTVHWKTEGLTAWESLELPGAGPVHTWTLDVTGQHRPAILYYVTVSGCGEGSAGSAAAPERVTVL